MSIANNTETLFDSTLKGHALAASGGIFFPLEEVGTCAWIIATPDRKEWNKGGQIVQGEPQD